MASLRAACGLLVVFWSTLSLAGAEIPRAELERLEEQAFKEAAALAAPSIVQIQTVGGLDRVGRVLTGTGPTSGVVVSPDGYIISSSFNFLSKPSSVLVTLADGRRFPAEIVATDRSKMLTLLKIDANELTPAEAAPRESLRVGQWAIALGRTYESPLPNMSVGIVSALNRVWGKAIQTDAKVSPVNYGGPLVDIQGRVMGVLVPLSPQESDVTAGVEWYDSGIGFAVPLEDVYASLDRLKTGKDLLPGLLGISLKGGDLYAAEPVIDRIRYDSPGQKGGLETGDVIVEIDGQKVVRPAQVKQVLGNKYADESLDIVVRRGDEEITAQVTLVGELHPYESGFLGILPVREPISEERVAGVGIRHVYPDSPAEKAGLQPRDRIVRFNDVDVSDAASLLELVGRLRPDEVADVVYEREGEKSTVEVTLASIPNSVPDELSSQVVPEAENGENAPRTGRFTETMPAHQHEYWAYVPDDYNPDHEYTLMVWIHPDGDTMEAALYGAWKSLCDRRGIVILAPKAAKVGGWEANEAEFVKDAVEEFRQTYSIADERIFLHGYSTGGTFAYHLALKYRDLFRGIATAGAPLRSQPPENVPEYRLQFHLVSGEKDAVTRLVEATAKGLRGMKYPTSLRIVEGHDQSYPPEETVEEIARWADALDRI